MKIEQFFIVAALALALCAAAAAGQLKHVVSHDNATIKTDPTTGKNAYPSWAVFPSAGTDYRKVDLQITYRCPDGLHCGEWDYIDAVILRRTGGQSAPTRNIEIARLITPYGWRFDSTWSFTWHSDITDFGLLLHDSVEVEFLHTGYESNSDRGWVVTVDFAITEGRPAMKPLGIDTLWCGSFPYGDTAQPIESRLTPINIMPPSQSASARLRIHQTGHGMDDKENCAEFCSKLRWVFVDDSLFNERMIWRRCGLNPLYPQSGTWIFDRANWCPGSVVFPDVYDVPVTDRAPRSLAIEMEPYTNPSQPTANYYIFSYVIYYAEPWAHNDVSLEEIVIPSDRDETSRLNPACANPVIVVKNNGSEILRSMTVRYGHGVPPPESHQWIGKLAPQQLDTIELPGIISPNQENKFIVRLSDPNGRADEYPADNEGISLVPATTIYGGPMILSLRTNGDSAQTGYRLLSSDGTSVRERRAGSLTAYTNYRDTLNLRPGCYQLIVSDSAGDGLDFWFNPEGGYGFVRLLDFKGHLLKAFGSDFGSEINYWFRVAEGAPSPDVSAELPIVAPFPPRNQGTFELDLFFNEPTSIKVVIVNEAGDRIVLDAVYTDIKETMLPIDISSAPDGVYFVKVTAEDKTVSRRIRIKRGD